MTAGAGPGATADEHLDGFDTRVVPVTDGQRVVGWYRDPVRSLRHRYWDGRAWSEEGDAFGVPSPRGPVD